MAAARRRRTRRPRELADRARGPRLSPGTFPPQECLQVRGQLAAERSRSLNMLRVFPLSNLTTLGISPDSNPTHREYLTKLCEDAEKRLMTLCQKAFTQRARVTTRDPLFQETLQHLTFCQSKCEAFHGRAESLQLIEDYLRGPAQHPFTIHGPSGCGKTSLVAMAAKLCHKIYENKVITIIRLSQILTARATVPYFPHHFVW
ncbi:hypothetical protein RRG08_020155, partial [Elysia crispata]